MASGTTAETAQSPRSHPPGQAVMPRHRRCLFVDPVSPRSPPGRTGEACAHGRHRASHRKERSPPSAHMHHFVVCTLDGREARRDAPGRGVAGNLQLDLFPERAIIESCRMTRTFGRVRVGLASGLPTPSGCAPTGLASVLNVSRWSGARTKASSSSGSGSSRASATLCSAKSTNCAPASAHSRR
jgi:hypothetical protein